MAGIGGTRPLPVLRHPRQLAGHCTVSRRSEPSLAPSVVTTKPERPGEVGPYAPLNPAVDTTRPHRTAILVGNVCRHDARQEPGAVVPHARIRAGGGQQRPSLLRSPPCPHVYRWRDEPA